MKQVISIFALTWFFAMPGIAQESFKYEKQIDALVKPFIENKKCAAVSIGIVLDGKTWTANYGSLSQTDKATPTADTVYEIGSVSKVFTSLLLADAVTAGKVELDQPIGTLMTQLQESNPEVGENVTLKHLSHHMSGLPRMPSNIKPPDPNNPFAGYKYEMLDEFMKSVKLKRKPGWIYEYSNLGAGLLGDMLANQAKVNYETLLKDRVLKPLKMNDTTITLSSSQNKRLAPPHNSALLPDHKWDFDALAGAGAISSTTNDMIRFMQANVKPPENETGKALELAWKQHLPRNLFGRPAMGLGWVIERDGSTRWHNGQTGGYHSMMLINRDLGAGVILLTNTAEMETDGLASSIFQTIVGNDVQPRDFAKTFKVDPKFVQRLVGKYQLAPEVVIDVEANGDKLMVRLTGQGALRVYPESDTVWNYRAVKAQLRFDVPDTGKCTKVTLHQNGRKMPAPRIEK